MFCRTTPGRERIRGQALGSTVGTTDTNGNLVNTTVYSAFGGMSYASGSLPTDKTYTGQRLDGTGLYYYGARYYDPALPIRGDEQGLSFLPINRDGIRKMRRRIGRFISPDTIVPDPFDPQSLNRYSYCLNNPLKYVDPTGHYSYDYYSYATAAAAQVYRYQVETAGQIAAGEGISASATENAAWAVRNAILRNC